MQKIILYILLMTFLLSCEGFVGEKGVVVDFETGERIENVSVKMDSDKGSKETTTDSIGFFSTLKFVSCGFSDCDYDYIITFEKDGYETISINDNYWNSENEEYLDPETKDTLIVKMTSN